jgi:hypothetical protein
MLKPEQAKARLDEWRLPESENRIAAGFMKLPAHIQSIAKILSACQDGTVSDDWQAVQRRQCKAALDFDGLSRNDRAALFSILSPHLTAAMEDSWQLLKSMPYQSGDMRKAFRAPSHAQATAELRSEWLIAMANMAKAFPAELLTVDWLAAWAPYLSTNYYVHGAFAHEIGVLLSGSLSASDGEPIFEILRQSLSNQHEIGAMGRHVTSALLLSDRTEGWELIEKTLLAAQRQEGLRQAILEGIDFAHPNVFRRMLRVILENDLIRFSATVRAIDVWFGHLWAATSTSVFKKMLTQLIEFLDDPAARDSALAGKDAEAAFLALWCVATEDAVASIEPAHKLLAAKSVEMRYVAAQHLANLNLDVASAALAEAIDDEDLRVAIVALRQGHYEIESKESPDILSDGHFEKIERLLDRVPTKVQKLKPLVWPWTELQVKQADVAGALLHVRGNRPATCLIPHLPKMHTYARRNAARQILEEKPWSAATRQAAFDLVGNASANVRQHALDALLEETLERGEIERLESYLSRTASDLRRGVLKVLLKHSDADALASAARLLTEKNPGQRLAGLELLRLLTDAKRGVVQCRQHAEAYRAERKKLSKQELAHLDEIAKDKASVATLDDALGLMDPAERTPVVAPRNLNTTFITPAAVECLKSLDNLIHEYREATIRYKNHSGAQQEELLGNVRWGFPDPNYAKPRENQAAKMPLDEVWSKWFHDRPKELRDSDGLELVRALIWIEFSDDYDAVLWRKWANSSAARKKVAKTISGGQSRAELRYEHLVRDILQWLLFLNPVDPRNYLLDATETAYSLVPACEIESLTLPTLRRDRPWNRDFDSDEPVDWREDTAYTLWPKALERLERLTGVKLTTEQQLRQWRLFHWLDEPIRGAARERPDSELALAAYENGAATLADIADQLLGPRAEGGWRFDLLISWTLRKRSKDHEAFLARHPPLRQLLDRAIARMLELELARGDAPTPATVAACVVRSLFGTPTLLRILRALGKAEFAVHGIHERRGMLTHLARVTYPAVDEQPHAFVKQMREAVSAGDFPEQRLLQLTFLAPQWTKFVQAYFEWEGCDEGVYWFLAHMSYSFDSTENAALAEGAEQSTDDEAAEAVEVNEPSDTDDEDAPKPTAKLSAWQRLILERTPLSDHERAAGAIDVQWFQRTYELLGPKRWQALAQAARFAANASQAKRAQFIADVLLKKVKRTELIAGIKKKQFKEHVRMLGLLPLAGGKQRDADLRERCQVLRDYRRYANSLSGLTKPEAVRAWEIGMKNLAQTAGYADPLRLEWAVGAEAVKDLAKGPVSVAKSGVTVSLSIDDQAEPEITVIKGQKTLKSVPPAIKKEKKVAELTARATDIRRQASSIRRSLETAMCRGDTFTGNELRTWCGHALVAPLIGRLVVVGEGIVGYPDKGGKALRDLRGKLEPIKPKEKLRLAHPHDLLSTRDWHHWQHECFQLERMQPFKRVFRELYVVTRQEKKDGAISHRYDGQQVQPKQALALFGSRGWDTRDGVFKVFHDEGLTADVGFNTGVTTPAEVEGWAVAGVSFRSRDDWRPIKLADVPPRLFSEAMRDVDLVVSVAHAGGVDPEASASTVEMRSGLLRETCALLKLKNVRLKNSHALVDGELAQYNVHLGSGVVHRLPGGALCIVPVHAQHRGRLFLPFADDDPRTAEVISKVLLLARDNEIQDPVILEQIRR